MQGRIDDAAIRVIRERANLLEVVSDVVTLKRRGRNAIGLCPFHAEKTPSFNVSEEKGFFHCFGCSAHGDVFAFVMRTQSLTFPEAVRHVAERFGLPVPQAVAGQVSQTEPLTAANAAAAEFFVAQLASPVGARAVAYLAERGVDDEQRRRYRLGYAPGSGDALVRHLAARRISTEDALRAGLVMRRDRPDGRTALVDRFRDRVMFPITDTAGKVIAFGGRVMPGRPASDNPPPKYLNSAESPLFRKGHTLYGLAQAREAIRRRGRAVVVEGYLDVIACAQAGIEEVVAPLGTALTADQLRLLRRFSEDVIACLDGDEAGRRAAARSFPVFLEAGLWGRGAFLPAGDDPDTFVRSQGAAALEARLAAAEPLVEPYLAELAGPRRDAVGRRAAAARDVARILKRVRSPFERDALARLAAERLGVREEMLREEGAPDVASAVPVLPVADAPHGPEALLVELMATDPTIARRVDAENVIAEFEHAGWRRTAEALVTLGDGDRSAVLESLPAEIRERVVRRLLGEGVEEDRERAVADCVSRIRRRGSRGEIRRLRETIRAAEARGDVPDPAAVRRLLEMERTERDQQIGAHRDHEPGKD